MDSDAGRRPALRRSRPGAGNAGRSASPCCSGTCPTRGAGGPRAVTRSLRTSSATAARWPGYEHPRHQGGGEGRWSPRGCSRAGAAAPTVVDWLSKASCLDGARRDVRDLPAAGSRRSCMAIRQGLPRYGVIVAVIATDGFSPAQHAVTSSCRCTSTPTGRPEPGEPTAAAPDFAIDDATRDRFDLDALAARFRAPAARMDHSRLRAGFSERYDAVHSQPSSSATGWQL